MPELGRKRDYDREGPGSGRNSVTLRRAVRMLLRYHVAMTAMVRRRLTTLLCADVEGYARLMGADEAGTLETLRRYRAAMATLIERHDGRVVNTWGDAVIAEFPSAAEGRAAARKEGVKLGRKPKLSAHQVARARRDLANARSCRAIAADNSMCTTRRFHDCDKDDNANVRCDATRDF